MKWFIAKWSSEIMQGNTQSCYFITESYKYQCNEIRLKE